VNVSFFFFFFNCLITSNKSIEIPRVWQIIFIVKERPNQMNGKDLQSRMKILLVDDNPVNVQLGARLLALLGFQVDSATNGYEAVTKACCGSAFDLILMDCKLFLDIFAETDVLPNLICGGPPSLCLFTIGCVLLDSRRPNAGLRWTISDPQDPRIRVTPAESGTQPTGANHRPDHQRERVE
jgi:hypothetical protein